MGHDPEVGSRVAMFCRLWGFGYYSDGCFVLLS